MQFNDKDCSIVTKGKNNYSCLSDDLLLKISTVINNLNKCDPINKDCTKNYLYNQICDRMNTLSNCKKEACWQTYNHIKNGLTNEEKKEFKDNFKPEMPKEWLEKPDSWLSTEDIDNVLYHYQLKYPRFKYYGALPIDFNKKKNGKCLVNNICNINLKSLKKDHDSIGMVFNTDKSTSDGEHWFSVYIDMVGINRKKQPSIYFFDSTGDEASPEITQLIQKLEKQGKKEDINFDVLYNDIQHQYGDNECGIYCIHFLISMLQGNSFVKYINNKKKDDYMHKFRKLFFINFD